MVGSITHDGLRTPSDGKQNVSGCNSFINYNHCVRSNVIIDHLFGGACLSLFVEDGASVRRGEFLFRVVEGSRYRQGTPCNNNHYYIVVVDIQPCPSLSWDCSVVVVFVVFFTDSCVM